MADDPIGSNSVEPKPPGPEPKPEGRPAGMGPLLSRLTRPGAIYAGGLAIALAVAAVQIADAVATWNDKHRDAARTVANLALIAEQEVERTLRGVDLSLKTVAELIELAPSRRLDDPAVGTAMNERLKDLPFVRSIVVFDAEGHTVRNTTGMPVEPAVSASDREFFAAQRDGPGRGFHIGAPIVGRTTGQVAVPMSRRIAGPGEAFAGVVAAFVDPNAMAQAYAGLDVGAGGAVALIRADGTMLARFPYRAEFIGRSVRDTPLFRERLPKSPTGVAQGARTVDGVPRLYGYRELAAFPVVVFVGVEQARILRESAWSIAADAASAAVFAGVIALAALLLGRARGRQDGLLARATASEERFRDFAGIASDWLWETDASLRFSFFSQRRADQIVDPERIAMGRTRAELASAEEIAADPRGWERHLADLEAHRPFRDFGYWRTRPDGARRYISTSGAPVFDRAGRFQGYRGVASDLTERKLAEQAAQDARSRLFDAIDSLPDTIAIFDRDDRLAVCNKAFIRPQYRGVVAPGTKFEEIARIASREVTLPSPWGDTPEAWFAERMRRHADPGPSFETHYKDGRWGRITEMRTHDGGMVVTRTDVTQLKRAEQAANEARLRLFDAIDAMPDGFALYDAEDLLVLWNAAYARNSPPGVVLRHGMPFAELISSGIAARVVVPNALGETRAAWIQERLHRHRRPEGSFDVPLSDGIWRQIVESRTREGGVVSLVLDITQRRHAEQEAREARARLVDAIESLPDGFAFYGADDRLVLCNTQYRNSVHPSIPTAPGTKFADAIAASAPHIALPDDLAATEEEWIEERMRRHREGPRPPMERMRKDGKWLRVVEGRTSDGGTVILNIDITALKQAERAIEQSRARLDDAIESLPEGFALFDANDCLVMHNKSYRSFVAPAIRLEPGLRFADLIAAAVGNIRFPNEVGGTPEEWLKERMRRHREPGRPMEWQLNDGRWLRVIEGRTREGGTVILNIDATARHQAEQAIEQARARLQGAIDSLSDGFALYDAEDRFVLCNASYRRFLPPSKQPKPGDRFADLLAGAVEMIEFPNALAADAGEFIRERMRRHRDPGVPMEWPDKGGRWRRVVEGRTGDGGTAVLNIDITALKAAEDAARQAHERMIDAIDSLPDPFAVFDRDDKLVHANREYSRPLAVKPVPGTSTFQDVVPHVAAQIVLPDALGTTEKEWIAERMRRHRTPAGPFELHYKTGQWGRVVETRMRDGGTVMLRTDITEPKRVAAQQGAVAALSQLALKTADPIALCQHAVVLIAKALSVEMASALELEPDGRNLNVRAAVGWKDGTIGAKVPTGAGSLAGLTLAANKPLVMEDIERETRFTPSPILIAHKVRSGMTVVIPGQPRPWGALGAYSTGLRSFDQSQIDFMQAMAFVLSSTIERRRAEQALAQIQRLESLGQLTGGIAHDFNNLLTVIIGQSDLLAHDFKPSETHGKMAHAINLAATRAADLTSQLLAFARGQTLQPANIDANALVAEIEPLLHRTLGEHIAVRVSPARGLPPCRADRTQLVAALVNLSVNARDAMKEGGSLTIETAPAHLDAAYAATHQEVTPGDYVQISVSDTGTGMPPEVLERMFEPFFTTKPVGQGTGLGLSMVYGFVKQSGGHVAAYSEVGHGTTVKLYLPVASQAADSPVPPAPAQAPAGPGGGEIVLLVEDDAMVRAFAAEQLRRAGFRVIEAGDGPEALDRLRANKRVDLLFSDIVMPQGLSGPDLARKARRIKPGLPVLLTSGYPAGALTDQKNGAGKFELLDKPYSVEQLLGRIRAILARR